MLNMTTRIGILGVLVAALFGGCAMPKVMIRDSFVPNTAKVARYSVKMTQAGNDDRAALANFYIQVCDVQGTTATNCKTTLVLENITDYSFSAYMAY